MAAIKRAIAILLAGLLVLGVLGDPYTFHLTASDFVQPASWWQLTLGLADAALLALVGLLVWRRRPRAAFAVAAAEVLYALALGIVFVERDGVARFIAGIGAEQYLTEYLGMIAMRVVLLLLVHALLGERREAAP